MNDASFRNAVPVTDGAGTLIHLQGIVKDYPKVTTGGDRLRTLAALLFRKRDLPHFRALDGVDLEVRRGESVGIIGENGAGKSTLLKIIAGVVRPTAGDLRINGRIGALLELGSGFHPDYTGRENIFLSSALMGLSRRATQEKVESIIEFADIGDHIDEPIKHYSSGMVVRLGFAVAAALTPDVLITDEVLAVGDESFQKKCIQWLEGFRAKGGTLLLCSHSMYHVQTLCSRALWLHHGAVRLAGKSFDVTREYLSYHEEKSRQGREARVVVGTLSHLEKIWTEDANGAPTATFARGEALALQGVAFEPDDRPPVLLFGIVRADGTSVYGSHSNEYGFQPARIAPRRFSFAVRFDDLSLLPGKYVMRAHVLDPEGLRLFDTLETEFVVTGDTRDYGLVSLPHRWLPGSGGASSSDGER
ncbi:MAG: ABC transporter ATP-binding protein [Bacillota bacterium]